MLIAYVDESSTRDLYFVAAAIGSERMWDSVESAFERIRNDTARIHGTPAMRSCTATSSWVGEALGPPAGQAS